MRYSMEPDDGAINEPSLDEAISLLQALVSSYDRMPDGELGKGLTNGDFLRADDH